jgi:oligopeptide transport system permease protein
MGKYLLRRILQMIPVVLGTTLLVYALVFALPGDPVQAMFGDKPVNPAVAAQIRAEYNLDKPFFIQYLLFLKNALTLDFGQTFAGQPVISESRGRSPSPSSSPSWHSASRRFSASSSASSRA